MTKEELGKVKFHFVCSMAMDHEHTMTYASEDGRLGFCDHTPKRKNGDFGKTYRHWQIDGKVYKTMDKFLTALADFKAVRVRMKVIYRRAAQGDGLAQGDGEAARDGDMP